MDHVRWGLNSEASHEVRRQVHRQRIDRRITAESHTLSEIQTIEHTIIVNFLQDEFGELVASTHQKYVDCTTLPDVRSWSYPGEWTSPFIEDLAEVFGDRPVGHLFSNSGLFTIALSRI
jgi:hypothetical protein